MKKVLLTITSILLLLLLNVNAQSVYKIHAGQGYTSNIYVLDPVTLDTLKFIPEVGGYRIAHCRCIIKYIQRVPATIYML